LPFTSYYDKINKEKLIKKYLSI